MPGEFEVLHKEIEGDGGGSYVSPSTHRNLTSQCVARNILEQVDVG